ncbi:ATP-dependent DNA helicase PIF1-like [Limulus polyphemus]|uniref:ATP-dependent DNA helicase PIF1 n=1 Tax=Limulus polyphemus TaxID=6850 RepID=A0ABM1BRA7_LIMPO|nr:ATP-dependent DNA helicase PIF1-like [Limulus polyphemus]
MNTENPELTCTVVFEVIGQTGSTGKRGVYQNAFLSLYRNEFRDILIKIEVGKSVFKYIMGDITIHKRFLKDGKATIYLKDYKVQLLLSNCPPSKLAYFLKILSAKLQCLKNEGKVKARQKLLSDKPKCLEQISPLTSKDISTLQNISKQKENIPLGLETPKRLGKRKREQMNYEEESPQKHVAVQKYLNVVQLTTEQKHVLKAVMSGKNLFFTGSAGTGKSYLLKRIISALPPNHTVATASTGIAACQIGGITLHSFAGIGSGSYSLEQCIKQAQRKEVAQQWRRCQHLVVDEISMVDGTYFQKLEKVARVVRNNDKPFGGIQLILCGDFLQLPPVSKSNENRLFCFQTSAWKKCIQINMELTQVKRQKDLRFINILNSIRLGRCPDTIAKILASSSDHQIEQNGIKATRLCTHKEDVDYINRSQLQDLPGNSKVFKATDSDPSLSQLMDKHCPVSTSIELKQDTQIMLTKNLDVQRGLVNGARGVIVGFENNVEGLPVIKFVSGAKETIRYEKWTIKAGSGIYISRRQLPIKLAWAMSIHKSQGMTLDCVEISLSRVFECGQAYVALSRAQRLNGLRIIDFNSKCVRADPDVLKFYSQLQKDCMLVQSRLDNHFRL